MSAEFFIHFENQDWLPNNAPLLRARLSALDTFVPSPPGELWLRRTEEKSYDVATFPFDVRFFVESSPPILMEVSAHPPSIEKDIHSFFRWLKGETPFRVVDDDGEESTWGMDSWLNGPV